MTYLAQLATRGVTINALGDSISMQSVCQSQATVDSRYPAWQPGKVYALSDTCQIGGYAYWVTTAGTSGATGPTPTSLTDGSVGWHLFYPATYKDGFLAHAEAFSCGGLRFDMDQGYCGFSYTLRKVIVTNRGAGYVNPVVVGGQGIKGTANLDGNGGIASITITDPGYGQSPSLSVTDAGGGTGFACSLVLDGSGAFAVYGCQSKDVLARLPDAIASSIDIFTVLAGTNDAVAGVPAGDINTPGTIIYNLKAIYEGLMNAGRGVIAIPITPRYGMTTPAALTRLRVNRWIRAYCAGNRLANPGGYARIALADCEEYLADPAVLTAVQPQGGNGGQAASVTNDGVHPNQRGKMLMGYVVWQAAQKFIGPAAPTRPRPFSAFDGYDATLNPGGNLLEGTPWSAGQASIPIGSLRSSGGNVYSATTAGTCGATAPTGTGTPSDGTITWQYLRPSGLSILASGTAGALSAAAGITYTNAGGTGTAQLATGMTLARLTGTASGTVMSYLETPWSDGHAGVRQVLNFALSGGSANEAWKLYIVNGLTPAKLGVLASDLGNSPFYAEAELELSGLSNLNDVNILFSENTSSITNFHGGNGSGAGQLAAGFAGDVMALPNGGKIWRATSPIVFPSTATAFSMNLNVLFNATAAASLVVKVNRLGIRRAGAF